jgi:aryl-alcohol dehydrogenase-like predicted oxidoreductase
MEYRPLGRPGMEVSRISLGCGNFGGVGSAPAFFGRGETREQAFALMDAARGLGINFFDTADAYGGGRSERWIGEWLRKRDVRDIFVATKVYHSVAGEPADRGLAPGRIRRQVEGSLERLRVERIDLYLAHEPDPVTPLEQTLGALDELFCAGKVRSIGLSNVRGADLEAALAVTPIDCVQNSYSLLDREAEREVLPLCERHGVAFVAYSPLAGGWLTGKYRRGEAAPAESRMTLRPEPYQHLDREETYRGLGELENAARARGVDTTTLALAWVLGDERVTSAIVGARRPAHLEPARSAVELDLSAAERHDLAALFG